MWPSVRVHKPILWSVGAGPGTSSSFVLEEDGGCQPGRVLCAGGHTLLAPGVWDLHLLLPEPPHTVPSKPPWEEGATASGVTCPLPGSMR